MGPRPVLPAERERLESRTSVAFDERAAHALPGRRTSRRPRCDQDGGVDTRRVARHSRPSISRAYAASLDEQMDVIYAISRLYQAAQRRRRERSGGDSSTMNDWRASTAPGLIAGTKVRKVLLMQRGCSMERPASGRSARKGGGRLVQSPRGAGRTGRVRARRGALAPRLPPRVENAIDGQRRRTGLSTRGVLEGAVGPGREWPTDAPTCLVYLDGGKDGNTIARPPRRCALRAVDALEHWCGPRTAPPIGRRDELRLAPQPGGCRTL